MTPTLLYSPGIFFMYAPISLEFGSTGMSLTERVYTVPSAMYVGQ